MNIFTYNSLNQNRPYKSQNGTLLADLYTYIYTVEQEEC